MIPSLESCRHAIMRNLKLTKDQLLSIAGTSAVTYEGDDLVIAAGPVTSEPSITLKRVPSGATEGADATEIASWDCDGSDRILCTQCFPDIGTISLILASGDIVVVRQDPLPGEDQIEIVGSVDAGIAAAAWSPDSELVAIATKADTLLLMTRDFEPTANITLTAEDVKVSNHVSVGWGKKETQFKGRGVAKTLRDPTMPEHVDEGTLSELDDARATLTWRGDGQFFALNSILESELRRRIIRVYSRDGVLDSVSEPVNGLEAALTWKPSGQTIAGVQRTEHGASVVFFERNGLRHGEFDLRLSKEESETIGRYIDLKWNVDSSVLAVSLADRVQLWTTGNYHWYLKQEVLASTSSVASRAMDLLWHPERPLHVAYYLGQMIRVCSYRFAVARGSVQSPHDLGLVAVIDGRSLKVTPLRIANVPPPMAFDEIDLPATAQDVEFNEAGTEIKVRQSDGKISLWSCDFAMKPVQRAQLAKMDVDEALVGFTDVQSETLPNGDRLMHSESGVLTITGKCDLRVPGVTSYITTQAHLIFTTASHLLKFVHLRHDGQLAVPPDEPEKDERCRNIERGAKIVTVMPSAYSLVLQMPRGNLETIYPRALVLAGIRHHISHRDYKKAFMNCRTHRVDMNILHDYAPDQFLQDVPVFLKQIKKVEHVDLFLSSLSEENVALTIYKETLVDVDHSNGLDVLTTHHANGDTTTALPSPAASKVSRLCDAFIHHLQDQPAPALQNIITAHVCKNPPDLDAGLRLISELRKSQKQDELESAVEHICFLADVNKLYDTALGLYDLDVALLVAQQSQKDPREYLPYLQSLHDMELLRRRFTIDNDLKRHSKALSHLHELDAFDEFHAYAVRHELYTTAMDLCRYDSVKLKLLMRSYADNLSSRNRYNEAGIAYEYVEDFRSAFESYRSAGLWQSCLSAAALVPIGDDELRELAGDLAASVEEVKNFRAAATIHLDYLHDLEGAVRLLCKGYHFSEATRLVGLHGKLEMMRSLIDPGLIEASASLTELLAEMKSQLNAQIPRLRELRQKKAEDPMAFLEGADGGDDDMPDNLSLAPTNASTTGTFMTRYTNQSTGTLATNATRKTSKNRRREERKRARGKKGTVYEEEYLVNSVGRLVERLNSVGDDVERVIEALMRRAMRERAVAVDSAMKEVTETCQSSLDEVFAPEKVMAEINQQNGDAQDRPWGGQGVLWEALNTRAMELPVLKRFERLML